MNTGFVNTKLYLKFWIYFQKNTLNFERFVCEQNPRGIFSIAKCEIRHVSRRQLRIWIDGNLTQPLYEARAHYILYYKYNTYQKYAIELREDICGWLNGTKHSYFMDWTVKKVINYSNFNHSCPYMGNVFLKVKNISIDRFPFEPLIPSGRYRLDFNLTETNKKNVFMAKLYFSVSDYRIEQY